VYFVKASVSFAVNRKRDRVEEKDILDGEREYSQYAIDSILVENASTVPELEQLIFEFVGSATIVNSEDIAAKMERAQIEAGRLTEIVDHLVNLSFLGLQVGEDRFVYAEEARELKKNRVLSQHFIESTGQTPLYEINKPFRSYLEVVE
jgi:hypothetical protein